MQLDFYVQSFWRLSGPSLYPNMKCMMCFGGPIIYCAENSILLDNFIADFFSFLFCVLSLEILLFRY